MSVKLFGGNQFIELKWWDFPAGERGVKIVDPLDIERYKSFTVHCLFKGSSDLIDVMLLVNACRNVMGTVKLRLQIPYFPYARQDRVSVAGESFSLQIAADVIKSCNFYEVEVWDAHSDVLAGMFPAGVLKNKTQAELADIFFILGGYSSDQVAIISPDAGALKKIYAVAKRINCDVICASKNRDPKTGNITETTIDSSEFHRYDRMVIVDDILDGGKTFLDLGNLIRKTYSGELGLHVTHGLFTKGKDALLENFDGISAAIDYTETN
jgi:ribose-phosphate pyrophosphokinase